MKLGYIVNSKKSVENLINSSEVKSDMPNIIIGWNVAKRMFPEMSLTNWQISEEIFWTVDPSEDRMKYENDLRKFIVFCTENFISKFSYTYIDLMLEPRPVLDLRGVEKILFWSNILYIRKQKSIVYLSIELCRLYDFPIYDILKDYGLEVQYDVENIFDVNDMNLVCFL